MSWQPFPFFHYICCMHRCVTSMCVCVTGCMCVNFLYCFWCVCVCVWLCECVHALTDRIGWWWFEMEFGLCVIMIIYLYAPPAYHIISYHITSSLFPSLSLSLAFPQAHTRAQKQIESSKSWLFASDDLDVDGLRWCADLFVTACLMSHYKTVHVSVCAFLFCFSSVSVPVHSASYICVYDVCICV